MSGELKNAIERAVVLCPYSTVTIPYLPRAVREMHAPHIAAGNELNLSDTERRLLLRALERTSWNQRKAADVLGISRKQLRTKMKNHGFLPKG